MSFVVDPSSPIPPTPKTILNQLKPPRRDPNAHLHGIRPLHPAPNAHLSLSPTIPPSRCQERSIGGLLRSRYPLALQTRLPRQIPQRLSH
ncbi:hypothetical protein H0H93_009775, partial [Arthromyces matolae]